MNWAFGVYIPFADTPLLRLLYDQSHTTETCAYEPGVYFMTCLGNLPFGEGTDISMVQYFLPRWQRFNLYIKYILVGGLEHLDYFSIYIIYILYIHIYIYILGMSSSQLTLTSFFRGVETNHQPVIHSGIPVPNGIYRSAPSFVGPFHAPKNYHLVI